MIKRPTSTEDSRQKYYEECKKELDEMLQHPLSPEQAAEQVRRNHSMSELQGAKQ